MNISYDVMKISISQLEAKRPLFGIINAPISVHKRAHSLSVFLISFQVFISSLTFFFMYKLFLYVGGVLALLAGCKKDPTPLDRLPAATQEGLNTAGWLLDGQAWVPARSSISIGEPVNGYWEKTKTGHSLGISFSRISIEENWGADFFLPDIKQAGTFVLHQDPAITGGLSPLATASIITRDLARRWITTRGRTRRGSSSSRASTQYRTSFRAPSR